MRFGLDIAQQRMPWSEVAGRARFADQLGFDGIWGFDHFQPMYGDGPGECFEANTTLAACAGGLTAMAWIYPRVKKWDMGITINGFLGGLVAITCPCYWVDPLGAIILGAIAGVVVVLGVDFIEWLRIDDPIGAVAVHGFAGIWGTLSLGLFASGKFGLPGPTGPIGTSADGLTGTVKGLFYGGGGEQLLAQVKGSLTITVATLAIGFALMYLVKLTRTLRVSEEGELEGLDIHEHGGPAYHMEFGMGTSYTTIPSGGYGSLPIPEPSAKSEA